MTAPDAQIVALSGGVGGAKLAIGLQETLPAGALSCIVNTGDDFEHLGLYISPDVDTLLYTLSGRNDPQRGWGRAHESFRMMETLRELGGHAWFQLGDQDLAVHLQRSEELRQGLTLSQITEAFRQRLSIPSRILPATDQPLRTRVRTAAGWLGFQQYFVGEQAKPRVYELAYEGAEAAQLTEPAAQALQAPELQAIIICPSNPLLSVAPMLAVPALRAVLQQRRVPAVAVSPLVGGKAIKGPAGSLLRDLGYGVSPADLAGFYHGLIDGLVIDVQDSAQAQNCPLPVLVTQTVMRQAEDKRRLAKEVLQFADTLQRGGSR
jgi:LPPG:FO 2-phospho-L-lactate transferase